MRLQRSLRHRVAPAAVVLLTLTACGGGGSKAMSESEFADELADICSDASRSLDRLDTPSSAADMENFAADAAKIYDTALSRLKALTPPKSLTNDVNDFTDVLDQSLGLLDDLESAGKKADESAIEKLMGKLGKLSDDQADIADALDVSDCAPDGATTATPDTTVPATVPATEAPTTTAAPTPLTLPATLPPATAAPATDPATSGQLFTVMDLAAQFLAPDGFTLTSKEPDQGTLDAVTNSELNGLMDRFGVATLVDGNGTEIADVWLGIAILDDPGMPGYWKDLDCGADGQLRQSAGGILGIVCPAAADSPFYEIFTATSGKIGISIYTRVPNVGGDLVADAMLEANP